MFILFDTDPVKSHVRSNAHRSTHKFCDVAFSQFLRTQALCPARTHTIIQTYKFVYEKKTVSSISEHTHTMNHLVAFESVCDSV